MGSISPNAKHVCVFSPVRTHARGAKVKYIFLDGIYNNMFAVFVYTSRARPPA